MASHRSGGAGGLGVPHSAAGAASSVAPSEGNAPYGYKPSASLVPPGPRGGSVSPTASSVPPAAALAAPISRNLAPPSTGGGVSPTASSVPPSGALAAPLPRGASSSLAAGASQAPSSVPPSAALATALPQGNISDAGSEAVATGLRNLSRRLSVSSEQKRDQVQRALARSQSNSKLRAGAESSAAPSARQFLGPAERESSPGASSAAASSVHGPALDCPLPAYQASELGSQRPPEAPAKVARTGSNGTLQRRASQPGVSAAGRTASRASMRQPSQPDLARTASRGSVMYSGAAEAGRSHSGTARRPSEGGTGATAEPAAPDRFRRSPPERRLSRGSGAVSPPLQPLSRRESSLSDEAYGAAAAALPQLQSAGLAAPAAARQRPRRSVPGCSAAEATASSSPRAVAHLIRARVAAFSSPPPDPLEPESPAENRSPARIPKPARLRRPSPHCRPSPTDLPQWDGTTPGGGPLRTPRSPPLRTPQGDPGGGDSGPPYQPATAAAAPASPPLSGPTPPQRYTGHVVVATSPAAALSVPCRGEPPSPHARATAARAAAADQAPPPPAGFDEDQPPLLCGPSPRGQPPAPAQRRRQSPARVNSPGGGEGESSDGALSPLSASDFSQQHAAAMRDPAARAAAAAAAPDGAGAGEAPRGPLPCAVSCLSPPRVVPLRQKRQRGSGAASPPSGDQAPPCRSPAQSPAPLVNVHTLPDCFASIRPLLVHPPHGTAVVHHAGRAVGGDGEEALVILGAAALYLFSLGGGVRRCVPLQAISEVLSGAGGVVALRVPAEFDILLRTDSPYPFCSALAAVRGGLAAGGAPPLRWRRLEHLSGGELRAMVSLSPPPGWALSADAVIPLTYRPDTPVAAAAPAAPRRSTFWSGLGEAELAGLGAAVPPTRQLSPPRLSPCRKAAQRALVAAAAAGSAAARGGDPAE
eukprot:TRINITY_DN13118_c3_g1_i1.p1 TRINITY_DN13118_c3_g1~~TRINITY_DN13118_c3_g1_i1.p1  ORF type:complete len:955 (+),score=181.57 TRINITY_DN13118_c3_g1_i1:74-2866(+)